MSSFNQARLAMWREELLYSQQVLHFCRIMAHRQRQGRTLADWQARVNLQTKFLYLALDKVWEFQEAVRAERSGLPIIDHDGNTTWSD